MPEYDSKEYACNAGDPGSILGLRRTPEKGMATHCNTLAGGFHGQRSLVGYSPYTVHGVAKSKTQLSDRPVKA